MTPSPQELLELTKGAKSWEMFMVGESFGRCAESLRGCLFSSGIQPKIAKADEFIIHVLKI